MSLDPQLEREIRDRLQKAFPCLSKPHRRGLAKEAEFPADVVTAKQRARWLYDNRFLQTSRKYRHFGRIPESYGSACQVLEDINLHQTLLILPFGHEAIPYWVDHYHDWAKQMGERNAYPHFASCHADCVDGCQVRLEENTPLNQDTFAEYKKLRGGGWPWWV